MPIKFLGEFTRDFIFQLYPCISSYFQIYDINKTIIRLEVRDFHEDLNNICSQQLKTNEILQIFICYYFYCLYLGLNYFSF